MKWIVLSYSLPAKLRSSPRVTLWRRLKRLGAISPAGGVQILPEREETIEAVQWLAQEIRQAKGEALVMHVDRFEGLTDQQAIDLFHATRKDEYIEIESLAADLEKSLAKSSASDTRSRHRTALGKLRKRHTEAARVDYFESAHGQRVSARLAKLEESMAMKTVEKEKIDRVRAEDYRNRLWVTRPRPHVDRLACIWLIRKFIDPKAKVIYATQMKSGEVGFDMEPGEFGHVGNLCTFEVMCAAFGLDDPALHALAEIVHEIDLQDGRYARPEISGIESILAGWQNSSMSDADREAQGRALFEGLYASLSKLSAKKPKSKNAK